MAKKTKKKHPHIDKSSVRKRKARKWIKTYAGTDVVKDYREHYRGVDITCAVRELQEIGYEFEPGYVESLVVSESIRIEQLRKKKEKKLLEEDYNENQDSMFYFIAGYTSGGAPYGVTWDEMGLKPFEDELDDDEVLFCYRHYEFLNKREKELVDSRLREDFSKFVSKYRRIPSGNQQQNLIEKVFASCPGGPLLYSKDFNSTYRKLNRKRENKLISKGVLPKRFTPTEMKKYFEQIFMLESERLLFRKITPGDFDELAIMLRDSEVMASLGHTFTDEKIRKWIDDQIVRYRDHIVGYFAAINKDTNEFIGQMGLMWNDFGELRVLEIGCMLKREYWDMGYATEGCAALIQYAFSEIGLNRVYISTRPDNHRFIRVAERIGMSAGDAFTKEYSGVDVKYITYLKNRETDISE